MCYLHGIFLEIQSTAAAAQHATCIASSVSLHLRSHLLPKDQMFARPTSSLVLFPDTPEDSLVDAVVNPSSPLQTNWAVLRNSTPSHPPWFHVHVPSCLAVCLSIAKPHSFLLSFTCLHPPTFIWLAPPFRLLPSSCQDTSRLSLSPTKPTGFPACFLLHP